MWEKVKLGDIVKISKGKKHTPTPNGKHRYINIEELHNPQNYILTDDEGIFVNSNDLIIAWDGANAGMVGTNLIGVIGSTLARLSIVNNTLNSNYLFWYLRSINDIIKSQRTGATIPHVNGNALKELEIPLPPLHIQEKIAEILDKADELRRKDQELQDKYDQLAQAIFIDMFGDPVKNEKGWEVKKLGDVCSKIGSGATPSGGNESYKTDGISLIRSLNVHQNEFKYKDLAFIDEKQADKLKNVIVEENDVLFNITGASVCRTTIVPLNVLPARVNQHVAILRFKIEYVLPFFAVRLLSNYIMNRNLYALATQGGATREAITKEQLQKLEIIVPPIHLQEEFAKKIEIIHQLKAQTNAVKSEELFQSLLQRAFKGELVS